MGLIGVNHVATVSKDLDGLVQFYSRIFGSECLLDVEVPFMPLKQADGGGRHVFLSLGGPTVLHAWQVDGVDPDEFDGEIFSRGRVDHFALAAESYADFERLRQTLVEEGATSGEVNDFGLMLSFSFQDPDGLWTEVAWWKDGPDLTGLDSTLMKDPIASQARA
ncbi:MAG TPA: VOC family protein [Actinomycetota bacterium]|nr:VOC family protein [Actinomycetota bacterium]